MGIDDLRKQIKRLWKKHHEIQEKIESLEYQLAIELDDEVEKWNEEIKTKYTGRNRNSGNYNSGAYNSGDCNQGDCNSGAYNQGDWNSGAYNNGNYNSGAYNQGDWNSGAYNQGDCNSGDWNQGDWNSGAYNNGNYNSGYCNNGNYNSGDCNQGDWNSGNWNQGDFCTGDFNISSRETGCFCTKEHKIRFFDKESDMTFRQWRNSEAYRILSRIPFEPTRWIWEDEMSEAEKAKHPEYETTGGYLKIRDNTDCCKEWWNSLNEVEKNIIKSIPNFDADKFFIITGIKVE